MYLMQEKQGGPIPTGFKRWPLKLINHIADNTCASPSPAGLTGLPSELSLPDKSEVLSKGSKWVLHTLV